MNFSKSSRFDFLCDTNNDNNNPKNQRFNLKEKENNGERKNIFKNESPIENNRIFYGNGNSYGNNKYNRNTGYNKNKNNRYEPAFDYEKRKKEKEEQHKKNLSAENFPEFSRQKQNLRQDNTLSYLDKIKCMPVKENITENRVKPGWVEIKRDPNNQSKFICTYGTKKDKDKDMDSDMDSYNSKKHVPKSKIPEPQVLEALVNLYNKRTQEYIDMWGYDTWEKMYRFPNYDYDYFNRLDEEDEEDEEIDVYEEHYYQDER